MRFSMMSAKVHDFLIFKTTVLNSVEADLKAKEKSVRMDYGTLVAERKGLEDIKKEFEKEKTKFFNQQEVFKVSVREAKKRWPTLSVKKITKQYR